MNILVTGGAGFIGSHLCEALLARGERVICVDNFFTGSKRNIEGLLANPNFQLIQHDIINPLYLYQESSLASATPSLTLPASSADGPTGGREVAIDQIYNLACPASPVHYQFNAIRTIKANTIGVINMLGLAKKHGARILQASTSEVYGDPLEHPQKETYRGNVNPIGPRACYDEGKRVAETLFFDYHRKHGLQIRVARIFNTYGPKMAADDGRVVSNFIVQALRNESLAIYGDGSQTRAFCYISDLVEALIKLMNADDFTGPMNLGNPGEFTVKELAEKIITATGSKSKIVYKPLPEDDPVKRRPDIGLAKEKLDWVPKIGLDEGLGKTIEYFRGQV